MLRQNRLLRRWLVGLMALLTVSTVAAGEPRWRLRDEALSWADAALREACPTDLLIVDEVGPVELLHRRGTLPGLRLALAGPCELAVVVVRPWLVPRFLELFEPLSVEVVDVVQAETLRHRLDALAARLAECAHARGGERTTEGVRP